MSAKSTQQLLIEARALIADPEHWTQQAYAKDEDGKPVLPSDPSAHCRCAEGAICTVIGVDPWGSVVQSWGTVGLGLILTLRQSAEDLIKETGAAFDERGDAHPDVAINDGTVSIPGMTPHQAVLAMFDRAITATAIPV